MRRMTLTTSLYKLVDIGANLSHPSFHKDYADVLDRAKQAGIVKLMITGCGEKSTKEAAKLAKEHSNFLFYTAGVHPHEAKDFDANTMEFLRSHLEGDRQCVAVGECGLDFNRNFSPKDQQIAVFEKQVKLACELGKPLFIHERDAHSEMVDILSRHHSSLPPAVIHCFTGTIVEVEKYLEMGLYIGLTGYLWKDRAENGVKQALRQGVIRKERLLLETDAPFMYPKVNDKKLAADVKEKLTEESLSLHKHSSFDRNQPCSLAAICELIAAFMGESPAELARATTENAHRVFGLGRAREEDGEGNEQDAGAQNGV